MTKKQETTQLLAPILNKAFTGAFTLNDIKAQGIKDVLVIVIDQKNRKHILTTPGLRKIEKTGDELIPGVQYAADFSTSEAMGQSGPRIPGRRNSAYEECEYENCKWMVRSERQGEDWIEKSRTCIGYRNANPACPLLTTITQEN